MDTKLDKARVLLINPKGWQEESVNLGLAYLAGALRKAGHRALILDLAFSDTSDAELIDRVKDFTPVLVGISVNKATAREGGRLAEMLSSTYHDAHFVAGGPYFTLCAEDYLRDYQAFDLGLMGEAEESIVLLAECTANGISVKDLPGVAYRTNGSVTINPWTLPADLDKLPLPDFDAIDGFFWQNFRYPVVTSRGCPFVCVCSCVNKLTGTKNWRSRSVKNVVDELEYAALEKGIDSFEIWDDNFALSMSRAKNICREIIKRKLPLSWSVRASIRADRIDDELAALMKEAGCAKIAFGMEGGLPGTFEPVKKAVPLPVITESVKRVKAVGIKALGYLIIGLPGDTLDKFIETVRFERSLNLDWTVFGVLVPYPESEFWDIVRGHGTTLLDITRTQHFGSDVSPIAFDVPEFPQGDMLRAFYIAQYFELFAAVERILERGEKPLVIYVESQAAAALIPGMIIACDKKAQHIVVRDSDLKHYRSYEIENAVVDVAEGIPDKIPRGVSTIFVCMSKNLNRRILLSNTGILILEPDRPNHPLLEARKSVKAVDGIPLFLFSLVANVRGARDNLKRIGIRKAIAPFSRMIFKVSPKPMQAIIRKFHKAVTLSWETACFTLLKARLGESTRYADRRFPFEDHPTHM